MFDRFGTADEEPPNLRAAHGAQQGELSVLLDSFGNQIIPRLRLCSTIDRTISREAWPSKSAIKL